MAEEKAQILNPVYTDYNENFSSKYIYFYHLTAEDDEGAQVYYIKAVQPLRPADMKTEMQRILRMIRAGNAPQPVGVGLGSLMWRHKSYFAVVPENEQQKLIGGNAVTFILKGGSENDNRTFRGGTDVPEVAPNIAGFFCFNRMFNKHGRPLGASGKETERFEITVNHEGRGTGGKDHARGRGGKDWPFAHEDTGTNTGPPLP
jgi:hypothetical protein